MKFSLIRQKREFQTKVVFVSLILLTWPVSTFFLRLSVTIVCFHVRLEGSFQRFSQRTIYGKFFQYLNFHFIFQGQFYKIYDSWLTTAPNLAPLVSESTVLLFASFLVRNRVLILQRTPCTRQLSPALLLSKLSLDFIHLNMINLGKSGFEFIFIYCSFEYSFMSFFWGLPCAYVSRHASRVS